MTRTVLRCATAALLLSVVCAAAAQDQARGSASVQAKVDYQHDDQRQTQAETKQQQDRANRNCLRATGSRIVPRTQSPEQRCIGVSGRSYDQEDLQRTGHVNIADALRALDPSVY